MKKNEGYYAIIPFEIVNDDTLHPMALKLYALITLLTGKTGMCWASNNYFAKRLQKSTSFISKMISQLASKRYIIAHISKHRANRRFIFISSVFFKVVDAIQAKNENKFDKQLVLLIKETIAIDPEINSLNSIRYNTNKKNKGRKRKCKFEEDSVEALLSKLLLESIRKRKPDFNRTFSKADLQRWSNHINKLIHTDKKKPEQIENIIVACQKDDFWQNNILSTAKLRKQFDQLELKLDNKHTKLNRERDKTVTDNIAKWLSKNVWLNRKILTRDNPKEFNSVIHAANHLYDMSKKSTISIENIIKYFKQCLISEYIDNNKIIYLRTIQSSTLLEVIFPQYLRKIMPSIKEFTI